MNYNELKENIAEVVKPNNNQEITGQIMQDALFALIENLGAGWQFGGTAHPADKPSLGTDTRAFYIAVEKGAYTEFGGLEVTELTALMYDDQWYAQPLGVAFWEDTEAEIGVLAERVSALEADGSVTTARLADGAVSTSKLADGAVTEEKLDTLLQGKVNDNVRTIPQSLNNEQAVQAQINVKLRDDRDNIFYDPKDLNEAISAGVVKPRNSVFGAGCKTNYFAYSWNNYLGDKCIENSFGYGCHGNRLGYDCSQNTFEPYCKGNKLGSYCKSNTIGDSCNNNTLGNNCGYITLEQSCSNNIFGNKSNQITLSSRCVHNTFENECTNISLGSDCANIHFINSKGISFSKPALRNITVLNINGGGLEITIPDEYLVEQKSSRHLIITSKATGESTADDLIFYFADEVATQENVDSQISAKTVRYDKEQSLTDNQKQQARNNINALEDKAGVITTNHLVDSAVTTPKIADGSVTEAKIAAGSISTQLIKNDAVATEKIADSAVTESKIADSAVTADKIAANAVVTEKIADGSVTEAKIDAAYTAKVSAGIDAKLDKAAFLTDTEVNDIWDNN